MLMDYLGPISAALTAENATVKIVKELLPDKQVSEEILSKLYNLNEKLFQLNKRYYTTC